MSVRSAPACLTLAVLLIVPLLSHAQQQEERTPRHYVPAWKNVAHGESAVPSVCGFDALEQRTYAVADLVLPMDDHVMPNIFAMPKVVTTTVRDTPPRVPRAERLIQMIANWVDPESWSEAGGSGTIEYSPAGTALVVKQTAANHERIGAFLTALRRLQDVEVGVEVRLLSLSEEMYQRLVTDFHIDQNNPGVRLSDTQLFLLMEAAQGDRRTNLMQAPKITLMDGQTAGISITELWQFVTGVESVEHDHQVICQPKNEPFETGFKVSLRPVVTADRKSVGLDVQANLVNFDQAPLIPAIHSITSKLGGDHWVPVPFTQYVQVPQFTKFTVDTNVQVADGNTAIVGCWTHTHKVCCDGCPEALKEIPCVRKLMEKCGHEETTHCLMLVTPHIIVNKEEEAATAEACPAPKPCETQQGAAEEADSGTDEKATDTTEDMAKNLAPIFEQFRKGVLEDVLVKYHEACAAGCVEEARRLANVALSLDPTCFDRR